MAERPVITKQKFEKKFSLDEEFNGSEVLILSKILPFDVSINADGRNVHFKNCHFQGNISFLPGLNANNRKQENKFPKAPPDEAEDFFKEETFINIKNELKFSANCEFDKPIDFSNYHFQDKFLMHDCKVNELKFYNTKFHSLADFWKTTFKKPMTFHKTDFNATVVFSATIFEKNVLFTYSLLAGKSIFARTNFKEGFDFSQAIISGDLQLFNLKVDFKKYKAVYVDNDDYAYQEAIDPNYKIPYVNKLETFRLLKHYLLKSGNFIEAINWITRIKLCQ